MRIVSLSIIFLFFCLTGSAAPDLSVDPVGQNTYRVDSLKKIISENKGDSTVAKAFLRLAHIYEKDLPDSAERLYLSAINVLQAAINKTPGLLKEDERQLQKLIGDAYSDVGALCANRARILQSLDYDYKSLKIREQLNDKTGIAEVLNTIAFIHHYYLEDYPHVPLETYLKALTFIKEVGDKEGESTLLHNIADIYEMQGDTSRALDYHLRSLKMREELGNKQTISNALNSLAIIYREKGDLDLAFEYGNKSLQMRREIGDVRGIAYSYRNLGETWLKKGDLRKAGELGEQSLQIGKERDNHDVIEKAALLLQKVFKQQARWKEAYEMNQLYIQMRDSNGIRTNGMVAIRQEVSYEYEKRAMADSLKFIVTQQQKDLKIEQQQAMLSREKILRNSIAAISVLSLLIAIIIFNNVRAKNKTAQIRQSDEIRRKISRDLHDEIGSGLTSISMICEQAKMKSKNQKDDAALLEFSERIRMQSRSVYEKLREVIWSTNPENDNLEVLISYMRNYVSTFFENSSIAYTLNLPDEAPKWNLKPDVSRNLIFTLKEALNNIIKHSNATAVDVSLLFNEDKMYTLKITDNGKGIDFDSMPAHHNGLSYMRKRMEDINGKLEVESKTGRGTKIEIIGNFT